MVRRAFPLLLVLALLAGPGFAAQAYSAGAGCEHGTMQGDAMGCNGDHGMAAACDLQCASSCLISSAVATRPAMAPTALPVAVDASSAGRRAGPPETTPPKR